MTKPHPPGYISPRLPLPDPKRERFARLVALEGMGVERAAIAAGWAAAGNGTRIATQPATAARIKHLRRISESHRKPAQPVASPPSAPVDDTSPSPVEVPPVPADGPIDLEAELTALYRVTVGTVAKLRILGLLSGLRRFGEQPSVNRSHPAQHAPSPSHAPVRDTLEADSEFFAQLEAGKANPVMDPAFRAALIAAGEDPDAGIASAPDPDRPVRVPQPPTRHLIP